MTLRVETGAIVGAANSWVDLNYADAFFEDRGDTVWAGATDDNKEYALIRACDYMQQRYRMRWRGYLVDATQKLAWPRRGVPIPDFINTLFTVPVENSSLEDVAWIPTTTIPDEVKQAQCLLARVTMGTTGVPTTVLQPQLGRATKSEQVGSLAVTYMSAGDGVQPRETNFYWDAENLLNPFFKPRGSGTVVRS